MDSLISSHLIIEDYLLYKKLLLGSRFTLDPLKKVLENRTPLIREIIDKEWRAQP